MEYCRAIPVSLSVLVFKAIAMDGSTKYGNPEILIDFINANINVNDAFIINHGACRANGNYMDRSCPYAIGTYEFKLWHKGHNHSEFYLNGGIDLKAA